MKAALLLSGGVDSSVALQLTLKETDWDITAYYLKIWLEDDLSSLGNCPWEEDLAYARAVCEQAGVPLKVLSLQREYFDRVVSYAVSELKKGHTPSPDIFCNEQIKFGAFFEKVSEEYDRVITGHYARLFSTAEGEVKMLRGVDPVKDQSYFLAHLHPHQLQKISFPLGHLQKAQVRELAEEWDLPNKNRKDSQGICFLGKIKYPEFVKHYLGEDPGEMVDAQSGKILGEHRGLWFYTIGQRSGLGLGGGPWYVSAKDIPGNRLILTHGDRQEEALRWEFSIAELSWIKGTAPANMESDRFLLKLRHGPKLIPGRFIPSSTGKSIRVKMEEGDRGIAAGQFCVIYKEEECLGCGTIMNSGEDS